MSDREKSIAVVERLFTEVWGDPGGGVPDDLIHDDYWSSEPDLAALGIVDGRLVPGTTGVDALTSELARYRDVYPDLVLTIRELVAGESLARGDFSDSRAERMVGDAVAVGWHAAAKHPTETFTSRGGQEVPVTLGEDGMSLVRVVDGRIFSADKYWPRDSSILAGMSAQPRP